MTSLNSRTFGMTERPNRRFLSIFVCDSGPPGARPPLPPGTAPALGASAARSASSRAQRRQRGRPAAPQPRPVPRHPLAV